MKEIGVTFQSCSFTFPATSKHSFSTLSTHRGEKYPASFFLGGGGKQTLSTLRKPTNKKHKPPRTFPQLHQFLVGG